MARSVLAERSADDVAAALLRVYRSRLPAAEDVIDPGFHQDLRKPRPGTAPEPRDKAPRRDRDETDHAMDDGEGMWFKLDVGRRSNADPRWLLPMLCRRGGVRRQDIGAIRIFDRETKFEIKGTAARQFARSVKASGDRDGRIEPIVEGPQKKAPRDKVGAPASEEPHGLAGEKKFKRKPRKHETVA